MLSANDAQTGTEMPQEQARKQQCAVAQAAGRGGSGWLPGQFMSDFWWTN
jgi:hypothetical protein